MLLPFTSGLVQTNKFDPECAALADRHYTRRKKSIGKRQFATCVRNVILRDAAGTVLFIWTFPDPAKRWDNQTGYNCAIFRNESDRRSSEIILEAERHGWRKCGKSAKGKRILEKMLA